MKDFFKDWKVHAMCVLIAIAAEFIGVRKFQFTPALGFSLFPMLYAMAIGMALGGFKFFSMETMKHASAFTTISVMFLTAKVASGISPGLYSLYTEGKLAGSALALFLQEFGNLGTAVLGIPIAVLLFKMNRAAIGCAVSISREGTIAVIGELYGLDSEEGIGVMGGYATGTVLGTIFFGLIASLCAHTGLFHPYALGAACGIGSASMMSASLGALQIEYPDMAQQIQTYAYSSQALTNGDNVLVSLLIALPMANWMYGKCARLRGIRAAAPQPREDVAAVEEKPADEDIEES